MRSISLSLDRIGCISFHTQPIFSSSLFSHSAALRKYLEQEKKTLQNIVDWTSFNKIAFSLYLRILEEEKKQRNFQCSIVHISIVVIVICVVCVCLFMLKTFGYMISIIFAKLSTKNSQKLSEHKQKSK